MGSINRVPTCPVGWRRGGHLCRVADNTVWSHWQVASRSSEMNFTKNYTLLYLYMTVLTCWCLKNPNINCCCCMLRQSTSPTPVNVYYHASTSPPRELQQINRVFTTSGNTGNLEFNCCSWTFLYNRSMIDNWQACNEVDLPFTNPYCLLLIRSLPSK